MNHFNILRRELVRRRVRVSVENISWATRNRIRGDWRYSCRVAERVYQVHTLTLARVTGRVWERL